MMFKKLSAYQLNIYKLYAIVALRNAMLMMPIIVLFFQERGLSMAEVMILQSAFMFFIIAFEIPSGYFADLFGRKISIVLGLLFSIVGDLLYVLTHGFSGMLVAEFFLALSGAFLSGADSAFLYENLLAQNRESEHKKFASYILSIGNFSEAAAATVGAYIAYIFSKASTFVATAFLSFVALLVAVSLKEVNVHKQTKSQENLKKHLLNIKQVVMSVFVKNKVVRWVTFYGMLLGALLWMFTWMLQPYLKFLKIDLKWFGIIWAVFNLSVSVFALVAHEFYEKFKFYKSFLIIYLIPTLALLVLYFIGDRFVILALLLILLFALSRALAIPIIQDVINKHSNPQYRATSLSIYNLFSRFGFIILSPFVGYFVDIYGLLQAFLISAIFFGSAGTILFFYFPKKISNK